MQADGNDPCLHLQDTRLAKEEGNLLDDIGAAWAGGAVYFHSLAIVLYPPIEARANALMHGRRPPGAMHRFIGGDAPH